MKKVLMVKPEKCTGCRTCELTCSFIHNGDFSPARSRITVFSFEKEGFSAPVVCQQCSVAACMEVCPVGAITRSEELGAMLVNDEKCLRCKMCTIACPFGATFFDHVSDKILKCDLCSGDPGCVKFCPSGALAYEESTVANLKKRKDFASKFKNFLEEEVRA